MEYVGNKRLLNDLWLDDRRCQSVATSASNTAPLILQDLQSEVEPKSPLLIMQAARPPIDEKTTSGSQDGSNSTSFRRAMKLHEKRLSRFDKALAVERKNSMGAVGSKFKIGYTVCRLPTIDELGLREMRNSAVVKRLTNA